MQHLNFDLLVDCHHFAGVADAAPAHIGDVKKAVDTAEIDERAEVGDVLDDAAAHLADLEGLHELLLPLGTLLLDEGPARDDDVATLLVDLEHEALDAAAAVVADVGRTTDVDLTGGEEDVDTRDVDEEPALDLPCHEPGDDVILLDALHHPQPILDAAGLPLREGDQAALFLELAVLELLEEHLDGVAHLRRRLRIIPLVPWDVPLALVADVDQHKLIIDPQNLAVEDRIDRQSGGANGIFATVGPSHCQIDLLIDFVAKFQFADEVAVDHRVGVSGKRVGGRGKTGHEVETSECSSRGIPEQFVVLPFPPQFPDRIEIGPTSVPPPPGPMPPLWTPSAPPLPVGLRLLLG